MANIPPGHVLCANCGHTVYAGIDSYIPVYLVKDIPRFVRFGGKYVCVSCRARTGLYSLG